MPAYATFPSDDQFHLLRNACRTRILCNLFTKGGRRGVREQRRPAIVTARAPAVNYSPARYRMPHEGDNPPACLPLLRGNLTSA